MAPMNLLWRAEKWVETGPRRSRAVGTGGEISSAHLFAPKNVERGLLKLAFRGEAIPLQLTLDIGNIPNPAPFADTKAGKRWRGKQRAAYWSSSSSTFASLRSAVSNPSVNQP
jgi:hypothetical protein